MATKKRNGGNQDYTNNADGFDIAGGTTVRKLTVSTSDINLVGGGAFTHTLPSRTTTLLGTADTPTVISVGSSFTSTGVPTATLPGTAAANDILLLILQSANDTNVTAPAGYTQLGPQNAIGLASTAGTTKLSIFWKRHSGSESAPTIPDTGDHTFGVMLAVRGCPTGFDPFQLLSNSFKFTTSTAGTTKASNTVIDNCLIMGIWGHGVDSASAQSSSPVCADLTSLTEQFDGGTADGTGGGIVVITGIKSQEGSFAAITHTWANTTVEVCSLIAFIPKDTPNLYIRPTETQTFIGTGADLDDTWVKPSGAKKIYAQICDGGGSGSGGNTATTAAGGGGGGGGGYDEAWYDVTDLGATVTVHAGKGGAVGVALNAAGNIGVLSEFDKNNRGPLTSTSRVAGIVPTAAASAVGGAGGSGSGRGLVSKAVGARISLEAATAGVALGAIGGRGGGAGGTTNVAGSPAEWGGGGGESGADTDAIVAANANGHSLRGSGGGSGGRTNANISVPGFGGGAIAPTTPQGAVGTNSSRIPYGGSGGVNGGSSVVTGGAGGFPGGGGGGGAGVAGGFGGKGGDGCVVVTTFF
jgi:hypothetical protein